MSVIFTRHPRVTRRNFLISAIIPYGYIVVIGLGIVLSTLRAIFGVVLYLYAKTGEAPQGFNTANLRGAIQPAA